MTASYEIDEQGVVHLMESSGDSEFTFCNRPTDGDTSAGGITTIEHSGPTTCRECKKAFDRMREGMKFARWKITE